MKSSKSNEWYTPSKYIEAARTVMGSIDLDPASCALANETVKAARYYSKEDNGLAQDWYGNVWLNPPYGKIENRSLILRFVNKLVDEYAQGNVSQAVLLCECDPDASWFQPLWQFLICFANHSVYFYRPSPLGLPQLYSRHGHRYGSIFVYLGPHESRFIEVFSQFGTIARRVSPAPVPLATQLALEAL